MKANELMLGDYVQGHLPNTPSKVVGIPNEYRLAVITQGGAYMELSIDDFLPIPLTPEIMEKNGWAIPDTFYERAQRYDWRNKDNCIAWFRKRKRFLIWVDSRKKKRCRTYIRTHDITFVHELQHALRFCGIEKEIVL